MWHSLGWVVMFLPLILTWACHTLPKPPVVQEQPQKDTAELETWQEGLGAFSKGDYNQAMAIFEFLTESTGDEAMYRKALYGLAATRLILAQNAEELHEAMELWDCWSQQAPPECQTEDPRMMAPLLDRISALLTPEKTVMQEGKNRGKTIYKNHLVYRDAVVYKGLLDGKEKEIARLRSRVESREREVRRLRHQIESLEAIHLKFQEKQKEVSSP
jgi:hypothetical protein